MATEGVTWYRSLEMKSLKYCTINNIVCLSCLFKVGVEFEYEQVYVRGWAERQAGVYILSISASSFSLLVELMRATA